MRRLPLGLVACLLALLFTPMPSWAAMPASEMLFPAVTKFWVSIADTGRFDEDFDKTQLGQLWHDPAMEPFRKSFLAQMRSRLLSDHEDFSVTWDELWSLAGGEFAFARMLLAPDTAAAALLMDVTGHRDQAIEVLDKIWKDLARHQAQRTEKMIEGVKLAVFRLAPKEGRSRNTVVLFLRRDPDVLCIADHASVAEEIALRLAGKGSESLSREEPFVRSMARCKKEAGASEPHLRWFCEPMGFAEVSRVMQGRPAPRQDILKILRGEGFDAIRGVSGYVQFATDRHEARYHLAVHAPGAADAAGRFSKSARMLDFPNGGDHRLPEWVPRDLASVQCLNWEMRSAFEASKTLVDAIAEEEIFEDTLETIRTEPNTAQIDIRRDLIGSLGQHVVVLSDHMVDSGKMIPLTESERVLFAAEATNLPVLTATIDKQMQSDRYAHLHESANFRIWEIVPEEDDEGGVEEVLPGQRRFRRGRDDATRHARVIRGSAIAVAHGHLLVATHLDFLERILSSGGQEDSITTATDYQRVLGELMQIEPPGAFLRSFGRTDEDFRLTYELIREGQMPRSQSFLGRIINRLMGQKEDGIPRPQEIDGSQLPDYEVVRRYLGPAGSFGITEEDGWFFSGFVLKK